MGAGARAAGGHWKGGGTEKGSACWHGGLGVPEEPANDLDWWVNFMLLEMPIQFLIAIT
jgi:hypothetical protein